MHIKVLCTVIKSNFLKHFRKSEIKLDIFCIFCKLAQEVCKIAINKFQITYTVFMTIKNENSRQGGWKPETGLASWTIINYI